MNIKISLLDTLIIIILIFGDAMDYEKITENFYFHIKASNPSLPKYLNKINIQNKLWAVDWFYFLCAHTGNS